MLEAADSTRPRYAHKQKAPLCLVIYALAVVFIVLGYIVEEAPPIQWLFPPIGLLMFVVAASFHSFFVRYSSDFFRSESASLTFCHR